MTCVAMIPARIGSERLKMKNLALVAGKPLISYAIQAAIDSKAFDRIVLNSDHEVFQKIAAEYGVDFYHRPEELGASHVRADDVVADFIEKHNPETVVWLNPTSPLQTGEEVAEVMAYFHKEKLDSLITVRTEQVHCMHQNEPINFVYDQKFDRTQDMEPVQRAVYSVMAWNAECFQASMQKNGFAFFSGKVGFYPVSKFTSMIVKTEEDLLLCDYIMRTLKSKDDLKIEYSELVNTFS